MRSKSKPTHIQNGFLLPRFTIGTHYFNIWLPDLGLVRLTEDYKVVEKKNALELQPSLGFPLHQIFHRLRHPTKSVVKLFMN
jgi:ribulose-5-phosphate 4-epimerase/fuculose-1-phosphate aldolase